jgi:hypothetical protein
MAKEHCNIAVIYLTQEQITVVDIWNYEWLNQWKWNAGKNQVKYKKAFYAKKNTPRDKNGKQKTIHMHRQIMNFPKNLQVDHINGNTLINLEKNLRKVTRRQNAQNRHDPMSSKYPGVSWHKVRQKWRTSMTINKKSKHLGYRDSEKEAYELYCKKTEGL